MMGSCYHVSELSLAGPTLRRDLPAVGYHGEHPA